MHFPLLRVPRWEGGGGLGVVGGGGRRADNLGINLVQVCEPIFRHLSHSYIAVNSLNTKRTSSLKIYEGKICAYTGM